MYKCFYHSKDLDGRCSGAIIKTVYQNVEMIGIDFGDPFPWDKVISDDNIIMVDFSLEPFEEMIRLNVIVNSFLWIDHHKTAIDASKEFEDVLNESNGFEKVVSMDLAGCELTWNHFYSKKSIVALRNHIVKPVYLLGRYDIWDHEADDKILPFQMGMLTYDTTVDSNIWVNVFAYFCDEFIEKTVDRGKAVQAYINSKNKWNMRFSFPYEFEGVRFICINNVNTGSPQFDSVWDPEKYDAVMVFYRKPNKKWSFHIYTLKEEIDLSIIATKYGGGGHPNACGFELEKLPFK